MRRARCRYASTPRPVVPDGRSSQVAVVNTPLDCVQCSPESFWGSSLHIKNNSRRQNLTV